MATQLDDFVSLRLISKKRFRFIPQPMLCLEAWVFSRILDKTMI